MALCMGSKKFLKGAETGLVTNLALLHHRSCLKKSDQLNAPRL